MKRIVREVSDWKVGDKITASCTEGMVNLTITEISKTMIEAKSEFGVYMFYDNGKSTIRKDLEIIGFGQITFEQAFAEWETKPIAFIYNHKEVGWLYDKAAIDEYYEWSTNNKSNCTSPHLLINNETESHNYECYQADSWDDLHLNVIPTLIRMARGDK